MIILSLRLRACVVACTYTAHDILKANRNEDVMRFRPALRTPRYAPDAARQRALMRRACGQVS